MGKFYDALSKAEREQAARKKLPAEPGKRLIGPYVHRERYVGRVPVDRLIAKPDTVFAEQFRKIRGNVVYRNMSNPLRSILAGKLMQHYLAVSISPAKRSHCPG